MRLPIFRYQGQPPSEKDLGPAPLPARAQNPNRIILRYTLFGVLFGCLFPIFAVLLQLYQDQLPFTLDNLRQVHQNDPLLWIIYSAPLFLGLFGFLAGTRQARAARLNQELSLPFLWQAFFDYCEGEYNFSVEE